MLDKIQQIIQTNIAAEAVLGAGENCTPQALLIDPKYIHSVCQLLFENPECYFDSLSCLTGLDNGLENGTMEVVYNLYSIPLEQSLMLKVKLERSNPVVSSVADIWKTANWHEREVYDLFGIAFEGHPDLRRILMPADWEGHPMRKDYEEPESYRGMKTVREED